MMELLQPYADIDRACGDMTTLQLAIDQESPRILEYLLELDLKSYGTRVDVSARRGSDALTALEAAIRDNKHRCIEHLIAYGARTSQCTQ